MGIGIIFQYLPISFKTFQKLLEPGFQLPVVRRLAITPFALSICFFKSALVSSTMVERTAVSGDVTGGISKTATKRSSVSFSLFPCPVIWTQFANSV